MRVAGNSLHPVLDDHKALQGQPKDFEIDAKLIAGAAR